MELTTETIIKIVLGVFVITAVVLGVYFSMRFYIIPYFAGIGFEGEEEVEVVGGVGGSGLCDGKSTIGYFKIYDPSIAPLNEHNFFFTKNNVPTKIYLKNEKLKETTGRDDIIGEIIDYKIVIKDAYKNNPDAALLNGNLLGGNQVCKP